MKNIVTVAVFLFAAGLFIVGSGTDVAAQEKNVKAKPQTLCPVMGDPINKNYYVDYRGHRIYFCCNECPDTFKKNPEKYMKILKDSGVSLEKAPGKSDKGKMEKGDDDRHRHKK